MSVSEVVAAATGHGPTSALAADRLRPAVDASESSVGVSVTVTMTYLPAPTSEVLCREAVPARALES